jgi:hypothetical protein
MATTLAQFGNKLQNIVSPATAARMAQAGGMAGKKAALDAASADLGGDRSFSGMKRKTSLGAGFDDMGGSTVRINFRPAGLWMLAERGRSGSGEIHPKTKQAVTPSAGDARAYSRWGPSGGQGTYTDAVGKARREVPKAAAKAFTAAVASAF